MLKKVKPRNPIRILFIGNSFTQRNDLPTLIEQMAGSAPDPGVLETRRVIANGASLRQHWNKGEALAAIQQGPWDYVVLQEQSTLPIKNAVRFHENVRLLDEAIKKSGGETVLYQTWARQNAPETQAALDSATDTIALEIGARVVPVGVAWQEALKQDNSLELYDKDGSHPSQVGSYLAACVFVATLFNQSPAGLHVPAASRVNAACARVLQSVAWQVVSFPNVNQIEST